MVKRCPVIWSAVLLTLAIASFSSTCQTALAETNYAQALLTGHEGQALRIWAQRKSHRERFMWDLDGDKVFESRGRVVIASFADDGRYQVRYRRTEHVRSAKTRKLRRRVRTGTRTIRIVNVVPSVDIGGAYTVMQHDSFTFAVRISDPGIADQQTGCRLSWDFGDGTTLEQEPQSPPAAHAYSLPGTYTVSLVARDKDEGLSHIARAFVTVLAAPDEPANPQQHPTATPTPQVTVTPAAIISTHPQEIFGIIPNPGMGWQSTDRVNTSGRDAQGFVNKVAYIKYYWKDLETANGVYNWTRIDQHLAQAHASGQKVAFRIVVMDNITSGPAWLRNLGAAGTWIRYSPDPNSPQVWSPRLSDPVFQQKHFNFLHQLGLRYDGHPDLDSVDIGTVGWWGEWHFFAASPPVNMPNVTTMRLIIDKYFDAFSSTPLVAQLENADGLAYAVSRGSGFRGDCLGNVPNQMDLLYEPNIAAAQAENAWRNGPIQFETCWTISYWVNHGFDLRYIFDWALAHHISSIANKNSSVPNSAIPEVERLLKRMGYRFVLRELRHPQQAQLGQPVLVGMDWENIGVAPSYGSYVLAFQLRDSSGAPVHTSITQEQIRQWFPGPFQIDSTLNIPANLPAGNYTIALGIVDPVSGTPAVQLSISGRDAAGWYPLSSLVLQ